MVVVLAHELLRIARGADAVDDSREVLPGARLRRRTRRRSPRASSPSCASTTPVERDRLLREAEILVISAAGETGLIVVVRGAGRHRARHRAVGGERPALARGIRGDVVQRLVGEAELARRARTPRRPRSSRRRGSCCCRSSRPGRAPGPPQCTMRRPIASSTGSASAKSVVTAADHERQRAVLGADDPAGDGRVEAAVPGLLCEAVRRAGIRRRRWSSESMNRVPGRAAARSRVAVLPVRVQDVAPAGQHRDDDVRRRRGVAADATTATPCCGCRFEGRRHEVEADDAHSRP